MDALIQLVLGMVGAVLAAMACAAVAAKGPAAMGNLFQAWPADPWPRGVQEDDDVRWSWPADGRPRWTAGAAARYAEGALPGPRRATPDRLDEPTLIELVERPSGTGAVDAAPRRVHGEIHPGSARRR